MINTLAIAEKYAKDGLSVSVDLSQLRSEIKNRASEIENYKPSERDEWFVRWKNRNASDLQEYKRQLKMIRSFVDEMDGMVAKAETKLKEK